MEKIISNQRPKLNNKITIGDFQDFYWLKKELVNFCKDNNIVSTGGKIDITNRIIVFLKTGNIIKKIPTNNKPSKKLPKPTSLLTEKTIIGLEYRSYAEKKDFMQKTIGKKFHFTVHLLNWFEENIGKKTYADMINEWLKEQKQKKNPNFKTKIAPQFEYNIYIRDFLKDNPNKSTTDAIKYWNIKKSLRGNNIYQKSDLNL